MLWLVYNAEILTGRITVGFPIYAHAIDPVGILLALVHIVCGTNEASCSGNERARFSWHSLPDPPPQDSLILIMILLRPSDPSLSS